MEKVTQGVHNEGGHIAVQLWHVGRISHNSLQPGQQAPVAPSAIAADTRTTVRDETGAWVRVLALPHGRWNRRDSGHH